MPKILKQKSIFKSRLFDIKQADIDFNGITLKYEIISGTGSGAVLIVPFIDNDIIFIKEYAAAVDDYRLIYIPSTKEFYYAASGEGAFLIKDNMPKVKITNKSHIDNNIYVSTVIRDSVVKILNNNFKHSKLIYMSSAIKFVKVAEGKGHFSVRLGPTHEWDTAAGQCIIEECGAVFLA